MATDLFVHRISCCICGYYVYHRIWYPAIEEVLTTTREGDNPHDRYAVAVLEENMHCVVRHLTREITRECYFFVKDERDYHCGNYRQM